MTGRQSRFTQADLAEMVRLYTVENLSGKEIGAIFGTHGSLINYHLKAMGVTMRTISEGMAVKRENERRASAAATRQARGRQTLWSRFSGLFRPAPDIELALHVERALAMPDAQISMSYDAPAADVATKIYTPAPARRVWSKDAPDSMMVHAQPETFRLLCNVARARSDLVPNRCSVSAVIEDLVRENWDELEAEISNYRKSLGIAAAIYEDTEDKRPPKPRRHAVKKHETSLMRRMWADGKTIGEICARTNLSPATVRDHIRGTRLRPKDNAMNGSGRQSHDSARVMPN